MCVRNAPPMAFNLSLSHPLCLPLSPRKDSGHRAKGTPKCIAVIFSPRDLRRYASLPTPADAPLSWIQLFSCSHGWNAAVMLEFVWSCAVCAKNRDRTTVSGRQKIRCNLTKQWLDPWLPQSFGWLSEFPPSIGRQHKTKGTGAAPDSLGRLQTIVWNC